MNRPNFTPDQQAHLSRFMQTNPAFIPQGVVPPVEGGAITGCSADRVMLAGGQLSSYITPEAITPFEMLYRRLPVDGIFTATPQNPTQFEMGSFRVPISMGLVILDYRFAIYRPSGSAAGDFVPLESNRLSTQIGWNIRTDANVQGNVRYELNPQPPANTSYLPGSRTVHQTSGIPSTLFPSSLPALNADQASALASDDQFTAARFQQAQSAVGDLSVMPQRYHREGILHVPAPWLLHSNQLITLSCHVFRGVPIPIAFFEAELFGFLLPDNDLRALQTSLAPCVQKNGGV